MTQSERQQAKPQGTGTDLQRGMELDARISCEPDMESGLRSYLLEGKVVPGKLVVGHTCLGGTVGML